MARDPRYDILFEPVKIGPVTARNRFYQVPHCNGMGRLHPTAMAVMRGVKAEGGWAVVSTEQCDIHPTTETAREVRLWDERDVPTLARMADLVHRHGGLASIELTHMGYHASNLTSREVPMAPSARPVDGINPIHARAMTKADIADYRRWHRRAALNARKAGFDIVCVYAAHDLSLLMHFLSPRHNHRNDEYGGSMENRARLLREVIEDTKEAVGDTMGVVVRFAVDELMGKNGILAEREGREVLEMLGELPDLWDVNCSDWDNDSITSRFSEEGFQEPYTSFVKQFTSKPVVGVGRYTSPDRMVSLIRKGVLDMIGAARPSIADPFLPKKIEEGRIEDIRECIGCNICVAGDNLGSPMRCTQNPTKGEEWRKGWHPERIPARSGDERVLVVGAGPAGLEAARALGQRGYEVMLAEAGTELGGRVALESCLPGLAAWGRVRDWAGGTTPQAAECRGLPGEPPRRGRGARDGLSPGRDRHRLDLAPRRRRPPPRTPDAGCARVPEPGAHPGRHHAGRGSGEPGRGIRRRPLLHGGRHRRKAGRGRTPSDPGHPRAAGFGLDRVHARAPSHPAPHARGGGEGDGEPLGERARRRRRDHGARVRRRSLRTRVRHPGAGHRAARRRCALSCAHGG